MARRETEPIGQLLLDRGWITATQLSSALSRQSELGGRLGTALLELGVISEDLLVKVLAEQGGVALVDARDLRDIAPEVIAVLPAKVAIRHRVVPFRASQGRVDLAVREEPEIPILDELAFVAGRRTVVHIANEARIHEALERYYGAQCPMRFKHLLDRLDSAQKRQRQEQLAAAEAAPAAPEPAPRRQSRAAEPAPPPPAAAAVPREPPPERPTSVPLSADEKKALRERERGEPAQLLSAAQTRAALERARNAGDIGRALVGYLGQEFLRLLLFRVGKGRVRGWMGRSPALDEYAFRNWTVGFDEPSVFLNLRQGAEFFLGRLPGMAAHERLLKCWRGSLDTECAVFPVKVRNRLVCAVYGDRDSLGLAGLDVQSIQRLTGKAAIAFEMLLMQKKLRS